jgi:hypothetical protein
MSVPSFDPLILGETGFLLAKVCGKGDEMINIPHFTLPEGMKSVHGLGGVSYYPDCLPRQSLG